MKTKTSIIALLAIAGSSLIATAQEKAGEDRPSPEERKAKMEERRAAWEAMTDEEKEAKRAEMKANHKALLAKYDGAVEGTKADGKLDREEIKLAREAGEKVPMMRPGGKRGKGGPNGRGGADGKRGPGGPDGKRGAGGKGGKGGKGAPNR